jgi:5,10-methylenetetrahydrofolate reductase
MPLKNSRALQAIDSIPGIKLGDEFKEKAMGLSDAALAQYSIDHALKLAKNLAPYVRGFHVISGGYPSLANELTEELAKGIKANDYRL